MRFVIDRCPKCGEPPCAIDEFVNTEFILELTHAEDDEYDHGDPFQYDESRTAAANKEHARLRCGDRECDTYWDTPLVGKEKEAEQEAQRMRIAEAAPELLRCLKGLVESLCERPANVKHVLEVVLPLAVAADFVIKQTEG